MKKCFVFGVRCSLLVGALVLCAAVVFADSKDESLKPLDPPAAAAPAETSAALEAKYRAELEKRLAAERESYRGSLTSLWLANAAVWACLLAFIAMQALSARKKSAELARLTAQRQSNDQ